MEVKQYELWWVNLDPTVGSEIQKTRPCLVISPDEMNEAIMTVIIAPLTTKRSKYPTRIEVKISGKIAWIVLDQIRTVDKRRLINKIGKIPESTITEVKSSIGKMLVD